MSKVAVILALYNGAKFIEKQLDSLLDQTKTIDQVIIGDDGSTDGSLELVQDYIITHQLCDKWSVFVNKKNLGHAANFINMCRIVNADYIFFSDQDDIWMPDKISSMIAIMEKNARIQFLYADVINTSEPDRRDNISSDSRFDKSVSNVFFSPENYFFKGLGCASCVKGTFVKEMLPYWTEGWEHDMFFWACAIMTNSGYCYNYPVIWRRIHGDNVSINEKKTLEKRIKQVELSLVRIEKLRMLQERHHIVDVEKINFVNGYDKILKRRYAALKKRNLFFSVANLLNGKQYYLHKEKGAMLDMVLIVFKQYPLK